MAEPDVTIPKPLASGATDQPNAVQPDQAQAPSAPPVPEGFGDAPVQAPSVPEGFGDEPVKDDSNDVSSHGLLHRAWDWVNKPIADNVLPKDIKTTDIVKAAAFEKMFGETYIPGINDFDTKAKEHFGEGKATFKANADAAKSGKGQIQVESHPYKDALRALVTGSAKDTSDVVTGLSTPASLALTAVGAGEAGALGKTAATVAKPLAVAAGTAIAGAGANQTKDAVKDAIKNGLTPENTQAGLTGMAQVAGGLAGAGKGMKGAGSAVADAVKSKLAPTTEEVGSTSVPVRGKTLAAKIASKAVPDTMSKMAVEKTGPAVAEGIGKTAQEAVGTEGEVNPNQHDRMGLRQIQEQLKEPAKDVFKKLDDKSGQMLSEAQQMAEDASDDYSAAGRKQYRQAMQLQDDIFDQFKDDPDMAGTSLDDAKAAWRKQAALGQINKKLAGATQASETGATDYQFKQGGQLSEAVDSLIKNDKDLLQRAGFSDDHIEQLKKFGRIIKQQSIDSPKMSNYIAKAARTLVGGGVGAAIGGPVGFAAGTAGEAVAEHVGGLLADRLVGKALTNTDALKTLNDGFTEQKPTAEVGKQLKQDIAKSDPTWAEKTAQTITNLIHDEKGELTVPFTGSNSGAAAAAPATETVGSVASSAADTEFFRKAVEANPGKSFSEIAQEAQKLKDAVKNARDSGTAAAKVAMDKSFPDPFAGKSYGSGLDASLLPKLPVRDIPAGVGGSYDIEAPGVKAKDIGEKTRAKNPEPTRAESRAGNERRNAARVKQSAEDALFRRARTELAAEKGLNKDGIENATTDEVMERVEQLRKKAK